MVTLDNEIEIVLVVWNIEGMDRRNDMLGSKCVRKVIPEVLSQLGSYCWNG